jgi:hypothetical protein
MEEKYKKVIEAIKVATKQEALSANQVSDASRISGQALVEAIKAQRLTAQASEAVLDFGSQGYNPCGTLYANRTLSNAFKSSSKKAGATVVRLDVAPGALVQVPETMRKRLQNHRDKFCTKAEADAGICAQSDLPGADVNAGLLFETVPEGDPRKEARQAYIQHVLGTPNMAIAPVAGKTPAGQAYLVERNRADALRSTTAYSLAMIDAANTATADLQGKSPNDVLRIRINQYFGGAEAKKWSATLAGQTERGLTLDLIKMEGLSSWIALENLKRSDRLNGLLSAALLARTEEMRQGVDNNFQRALTNAADGSVK